MIASKSINLSDTKTYNLLRNYEEIAFCSTKLRLQCVNVIRSIGIRSAFAGA